MSETELVLYSEAVDDPSLSASPDKGDDSSSEMTTEISDGQQHVTLITQDGTTQVPRFSGSYNMFKGYCKG